MPDLIKTVKEKLQQYGMKIYDHYDIEGTDDEHVFLVEDMIIFVRKYEKSASIAYQATTRPDIAAKNLLVISEVESIQHLDIMDSFIYNEENELVSGDEAYDLVDEAKKQSAVVDYIQEQTMQKIFFQNSSNKQHMC